MSERLPGAAPDTPRGRLVRRAVLVFFVLAVAAAGLGFAIKMYQFAEDLFRDQGIGFAGAHIVTYAFVAAGFLLLLAGTFFRGHYADIEKPKFDMLEREIARDRLERPADARNG